MTCKWFQVCPLRDLEEKEEISNKWKKKYCSTEENWKECKRYQLEEKGDSHENLLPNGDKIE